MSWPKIHLAYETSTWAENSPIYSRSGDGLHTKGNDVHVPQAKDAAAEASIRPLGAYNTFRELQKEERKKNVALH